MRATISTLALTVMLSIGTAFAGVDDDVKATFDRFVAAQNAHDVSAVRELLWDSANFLWISRGVPYWGRDAALKRFESLYQGTWKLYPDTANLKVIALTDSTAQLFVPIVFNSAPPGEPAPDIPVLMNQTLVKTAGGWRIASLLPIPLSPPTPPPTK